MKNNAEIHIVSFTIPYPADYGGVIDVFYKIKALYELGVKINLHCFQYDRTESEELKKYCKSVLYYHRPKRPRYFLSKIPFIVLTRSNNKLLDKLKQDDHPILFEGLHTTFHLQRLISKSRTIVVRMHNVEHNYYSNLVKKEKNFFRKIFFKSEALKLKKYEKILKSDIKVAGITNKDCAHFKDYNKNIFLVEAFHANNGIEVLKGKGEYILFHGNLSVHENIEAAKFIIKRVCPYIDFKFVIAGKNPAPELFKLSKIRSNVEIIPDPSDFEMKGLIQKAQVNLLISFQDTGVKLKLINALFKGRHCIVNSMIIGGSGLESLCHIVDMENEIISKLNELIKVDFTIEEINKREESLLKNVNNKLGAQKLINLLVKNHSI